MSKQDRQGVRTPADLERKYDFGLISGDSSKGIRGLERKMIEVTQRVNEFAAAVQKKLEDFASKYKGHVIENAGEYVVGYLGEEPIWRKWYVADGIEVSDTVVLDEGITAGNKVFGFGGSLKQEGTAPAWCVPEIRVEEAGVSLVIGGAPVSAYSVYVDYMKSS